MQWNHDVRQWLGHHPEVRTVFVSAHQLAHFRGSAQAGYRSAWAHLPSSVRRIIVIHDNPETVNPQTGCVNNALARHRISPDSCAGLRSNDLHADPEADAAYKAHSRRIRVINLNRYMCGRRLCFAVIGGALVRKDNTHLTSTFSTTLGPYLLRAVNRIIPGG